MSGENGQHDAEGREGVYPILPNGQTPSAKIVVSPAGAAGAPLTPPAQDERPLAPPTEGEEFPDERLTDPQRRFLKALAATRNITEACRLAEVGRRTVYHWTERRPAFRMAIDEAKRMVADEIEDRIVKRALSGPGDKSSARLAMFLLRAYRPERFNPREQEAPQMPTINIIIGDGSNTDPLPV